MRLGAGCTSPLRCRRGELPRFRAIPIYHTFVSVSSPLLLISCASYQKSNEIVGLVPQGENLAVFGCLAMISTRIRLTCGNEGASWVIVSSYIEDDIHAAWRNTAVGLEGSSDGTHVHHRGELEVMEPKMEDLPFSRTSCQETNIARRTKVADLMSWTKRQWRCYLKDIEISGY